MATKPAQICQLQKGKLVDTQKGFVDTFNWAVQAIANLDGGENCEVTWPTDDHPTIDVSIDDSTSDSGGGIEAAVYDIVKDMQNDVEGLSIIYTDDRADNFIPLSSGGIIALTADSNNVSAQFDAANQDYLTYTSCDGTTVDVPLPYVNGVANLSVLSSNQDNDRQLSWTYTRSTLSAEPIDLGVEFTDDSQTSSTGLHTEFVLKSADDSNVEFTFDGKEITIGVYYI